METTTATTKRPLEEDKQDNAEPEAKRARPTEYYQYVVLGEDHDMNFVYLLDMASPGAAEVHALVQHRIALDIHKNTIYASRMLDALANNRREAYSYKWKLAIELKALVALGDWQCLDLHAPAAQGHRGVVYYLFGFE